MKLKTIQDNVLSSLFSLDKKSAFCECTTLGGYLFKEKKEKDLHNFGVFSPSCQTFI